MQFTKASITIVIPNDGLNLFAERLKAGGLKIGFFSRLVVDFWNISNVKVTINVMTNDVTIMPTFNDTPNGCLTRDPVRKLIALTKYLRRAVKLNYATSGITSYSLSPEEFCTNFLGSKPYVWAKVKLNIDHRGDHSGPRIWEWNTNLIK